MANWKLRHYPTRPPIDNMALRVEITNSIKQISAQAWNSLVQDDHPFLKHQFLAAMETHGCVGPEFGWLPHHIAVYDSDELVGALPLYEKHNSYGEFVFDHAWADAYKRSGLEYFPKLVSAIPYTPAIGQRFLTTSDREHELRALLLNTALELARASGMSGFHCLFPEPEEHQWLAQELLTRHDCQFHWHNNGYSDFDAFLATLTSKKRKNIRQERRKVEQSGVDLRVLDGHSATAKDWEDFARFYEITFEEKWGIATFNLGFFQEIGRTMPDNIVLVLADLDKDCIAGALMYRSNNRLYGRHWGAKRDIDQLHFEVCYYQGIEYCIARGLKVFEPGAQGEHKISRGFIPTLTCSSHWLAESHFAEAIEHFTKHEQQVVAHYMNQLQDSIPYKQEP